MSTENTITTAAADVAAAPNATLDELVGTTTNTAILTAAVMITRTNTRKNINTVTLTVTIMDSYFF